MAGKHRAQRHGKRAAAKVHRRRRARSLSTNSYLWLGAGTFTLGVGAALASGAGVAHADTGEDATASSVSSAAAGATTNESPSGKDEASPAGTPSGSSVGGDASAPPAPLRPGKRNVDESEGSGKLLRSAPIGVVSSSGGNKSARPEDPDTHHMDRGPGDPGTIRHRSAGRTGTLTVQLSPDTAAPAPSDALAVEPAAHSELDQTPIAGGPAQAEVRAAIRTAESEHQSSAKLPSFEGATASRLPTDAASVAPATVSADSTAPDLSVKTSVALEDAADLAVSPTGEFIYVAKSGGGVSVVRTSNNKVVTTIPVPGTVEDVAASGGYVFAVSNNPGVGTGGTLTVVDASRNLVIGSYATNSGDYPTAIAIGSDNRTAYIVSHDGVMSVVDTTTGQVSRTITVGAYATDIAVHGGRAYVARDDSPTGYSLSVVDLDTGAVTERVVGGAGQRVAVSPDGTRVVITDFSGSITVLDAADNVIATLDGIGDGGVAFSPEGDYVYVLTRSTEPRITVLDANTYAVVDEIGVGESPRELAVSPNGKTVYVTDMAGDALHVIATSPGTPNNGNDFDWVGDFLDHLNDGVSLAELGDLFFGEQGLFPNTVTTMTRALTRVVGGVGAVLNVRDIVLGITDNDRSRFNSGLYGVGAGLATIGIGLAVTAGAPVVAGGLFGAAVVLSVTSILGWP